MAYIPTEELSLHLRSKAINIKKKEILLTKFTGTVQEEDLREPPNCNGFGRIRHFKLNSNIDWPQNPLPILPASKALGLQIKPVFRTQVFQNSICNWRCWYCFVDYKLLSGNTKYASLINCGQMIKLYLDQSNPPKVIDLTGGQPDLTPEWIPWMMETLINEGLENSVFLWSDDNLSNDFLWRFLDDEQLDLLSNYKMYCRVCCFKGFDDESFSLNTKANPALFKNQFELCKRLLSLGLDLYCYITLTSNTKSNFSVLIPKFLDNIQEINELLPLRIIPLRVKEYITIQSRLDESKRNLLDGQYLAIEIWQKELQKRFLASQLSLPITSIELK